ncbi:hypothetical protein BAUCODRAFT_435659 [Baudoinia panamericana UAMH 10762]|uniref:Uncharacterized protein n=1 Tax=Baudoinia panamericana (strain UAMH 10762) TaxID=717646 RepID=M2MK05_BAUPA|nr:uncharacterized protein BAUCODRAFT_435659 [Baudoinia panamericana UAMH 10762]EMC97016.1 hypothetical protein BAUCODRAFT_435659 [Baudoinia panamericana UAMH 10762]
MSTFVPNPRKHFDGSLHKKRCGRPISFIPPSYPTKSKHTHKATTLHHTSFPSLHQTHARATSYPAISLHIQPHHHQTTMSSQLTSSTSLTQLDTHLSSLRARKAPSNDFQAAYNGQSPASSSAFGRRFEQLQTEVESFQGGERSVSQLYAAGKDGMEALKALSRRQQQVLKPLSGAELARVAGDGDGDGKAIHPSNDDSGNTFLNDLLTPTAPDRLLVLPAEALSTPRFRTCAKRGWAGTYKPLPSDNEKVFGYDRLPTLPRSLGPAPGYDETEMKMPAEVDSLETFEPLWAPAPVFESRLAVAHVQHLAEYARLCGSEGSYEGFFAENGGGNGTVVDWRHRQMMARMPGSVIARLRRRHADVQSQGIIQEAVDVSTATEQDEAAVWATFFEKVDTQHQEAGRPGKLKEWHTLDGKPATDLDHLVEHLDFDGPDPPAPLLDPLAAGLRKEADALETRAWLVEEAGKRGYSATKAGKICDDIMKMSEVTAYADNCRRWLEIGKRSWQTGRYAKSGQKAKGKAALSPRGCRGGKTAMPASAALEGCDDGGKAGTGRMEEAPFQNGWHGAELPLATTTTTRRCGAVGTAVCPVERPKRVCSKPQKLTEAEVAIAATTTQLRSNGCGKRKRSGDEEDGRVSKRMQA